MGIREAYTDWATTYDQDRNLTRDLDQMVTRQALGQRHCQSILEMGCGTGKNTALLEQIGQRVYAFDFSESMIQRARMKIRSDTVRFVAADITRRWPCADHCADLIACNLVLEHVRDLSFIFEEAHRSLRAGGNFFVSELHPYRQYQGTRANFQRDERTTEIEAFVHHLSDFTSAAARSGFSLKHFKEWWHKEDQNKAPRLVSFIFEK